MDRKEEIDDEIKQLTLEKHNILAEEKKQQVVEKQIQQFCKILGKMPHHDDDFYDELRGFFKREYSITYGADYEKEIISDFIGRQIDMFDSEIDDIRDKITHLQEGKKFIAKKWKKVV